MSGHTPGPWVMVTGNSARQFHEISIRPISNPFPEGGNLPFPIASVRYPQHDFGLANARLIAAAPELLAVVEAMAFELNMHLSAGNNSPFSSETILQARAAIAKVTGKAP